MTSARSMTVARLRASIGRITAGGAAKKREIPPPDVVASRKSGVFLAEGLPVARVHEIEGAGWDAETGIAASSFAAALLARISEGAILWAVRDDTPFAPRLAAFGLDLNPMIFAAAAKMARRLPRWNAMEEALRTPGIAAAVGEVAHVTQSRRLHLICERAGSTGLILRR